jgi:CelD/BcsL family acetyltransferase involved in cellulose biosynthesis
MDTRIEIYKDIDLELQNIWLEFERKSHNHCFQSYTWIINLINFSKKKNIFFILQIILVKKDNNVAAILPFWIINRFGLKVLQWIGNEFSDYNGPIISNDFNYKKNEFLSDFDLIKKKLEKFDVIYFERQPSNLSQLENPFFFHLKNTNVSKTYFIVTTDKFHNKEFIKKKFLFFHSKNIFDYKKYINMILDLKIIQLNKNFLLKKNNDYQKLFYNKLCNIESDNLKIYTSVLKFENQELSYNFGILYKNYFYYLIPAYRDFLKKISPGKLLLYKILDWCYENAINTLDFGQGEEEYKKKITDKYNYIGYYNYINSYKGYLFFIFIILRKIKIFISKFIK